MEALLEELLPRVVPGHTFGIHPHQGKPDLLSKVEQRLRAYARMTWPDLRVVIVVDRDSDNCFVLKKRLTDACTAAGCDALERVLRRGGYYPTGMPKVEVARSIAPHMARSKPFEIIPGARRRPSGSADVGVA